MKNSELVWRFAYFFIEFVILLLGFSIITVFSFDLSVQAMFVVVTLIFYITFGLLRHHAQHDLSHKVMIEYILISALILILFTFWNVGRI